MNQLQHLLIKLAEEGAEVAQIALKTSQFGADEVMPGQPLSNFQRCHQELDDLWAMVEMRNDRYQFNYTPSRDQIEAKKLKVQKFLGYSIHLGLVEGETDVTEHPMSAAANAVQIGG